jgi:ATP-binding cassette subfamily F protein uup
MYCLIQNQTLILDEPTNDLDIVTLNVLKLLLDYPVPTCCIMTVTMDKIVDHFIFRGQGLVENFPGNYSDFRSLRRQCRCCKKRKIRRED